MAKKELTAPRSVNHGPRRTHMNPLTLLQGDCLDVLKTIPDGSIDMVMCDLPYGTTRNSWDSVIPLDELWAQYHRVCKKNAAIVLTASQPFTSALVMSNVSDFRYSLVWDKKGTTGFQTAKIMPLRRHEDVVVFYRAKPAYNPEMETRGAPRKKGGSKTDNGCYGELRSAESFNNTYYPTSVIEISNASKKGLVHPTQKPVALMEYLIKTYTNPGEIVLDNTMGSGTTGVACMNIGRRFVGIERDPDYFKIAESRIHEAALKAFEI
jgi:site-specific DNA-methyltransferase (adenine-specific)